MEEESGIERGEIKNILILEDQTDRMRKRMKRWEKKEKLVKIQRKR